MTLPVTRYAMHATHGHDVEADQDEAGEWVRYDDIKHLLQNETKAESDPAVLFHGLMDLIDDWTLKVEDTISSEDLDALLDDPRYCAAEAARKQVNREVILGK